MRKTILSILLVLVGVSAAEASVLFLESGHHIWTDANDYYDEVWLENGASLDFLGGSMGKLQTYDYALANLHGGGLDWLWTTDESHVNIHSASLNWLASDKNSSVHLYAYDITYHPTDGLGNEGWIEGTYLSDDSYFAFSFYGDHAYQRLTVVPEPTTLLLLSLGAFLLRKQSQRNPV